MLPSESLEGLLNALTFGGGGGAKIESIQRGITTVEAAGLSVQITPVDISRAFVIAQSLNRAMYVSYNLFAAYVLSSGNYVNLSRGVDNVGFNVYWEVVEFASGVSVQHIEVTMTNEATRSITISPVDPSRTFVVASCKTDYSNTGYSGAYGAIAKAVLTDAQTITVTREAGSTTTAHIYVVEVE